VVATDYVSWRRLAVWVHDHPDAIRADDDARPPAAHSSAHRGSLGGLDAVMTIARPPVVSRHEWEAARAAITDRERTVATAMHQLAAARKRMPMAHGLDGRALAHDPHRAPLG
jgi:hypothetical protein